MSKKITYEEAYQRFIEQGRTDIELCRDGYNGFNNKAKFWDEKEQDYFWAIPYNVFKQKSSHPKIATKKRIKANSFCFKIAEQKFKNRTDIELCEDGFKGWNKKSKFWDKEEKDWFWATPAVVLSAGSVHPKRADKNRIKLRSLSFPEAMQRFINQGRIDIELIEDGYKNWTSKAKFFDKEVNKEFWSIPDSVFRNKICHPERSRQIVAKKLSIIYKEAKQRFINQGRNDIELLEEDYKNWSRKAKFWDKVEKNYFWARPCDVFKNKLCHPKRSRQLQTQSQILSFEEARQRFIDQGRTDIKLCRDGYTQWSKKSKFWDKEEKDYFWANPSDVYKRKSAHPKKGSKNRSNLLSLSFDKAKQRFINQGRTDIELIKDGYNGWSKKSKFYDLIEKDYFFHVPKYVYIDKTYHPKRKKLSKNQIELFQYLKKEFPNLKIMSEYKNIIKYSNYTVDILFVKHKIIIEYNGDYWHCNPKLKRYNENFYNKKSKKHAKEIWEFDNKRKEELEKAGHKVLIVWEYDYKNNKETTLNKLKQDILKLI